MNTKLKAVLAAVLAATLLFFISGSIIDVSADEVPNEDVALNVLSETPEEPADDPETLPEELPEETPEETPDVPTAPEETPEMTDEEIGADFVEWLKVTFGSDYEYYYDKIIANWGTIEDYLMQFGEDNLPDKLQLGWNTFVGWLSEYVVIWAPILAVAAMIIYYIARKRSTKKMISQVVDSKMTTIADELNKQGRATMAVMTAQKALLGNNAKFAKTVEQLEASEKELNS